MHAVLTTYLCYTVVSLGLTAWVARTLFRNGALFLVDVFDGDAEMARAVNRLLVVGFWLINLGYVAFALRIGSDVPDARAAVEALSRKPGWGDPGARRDALRQPVRAAAHASTQPARAPAGAAGAPGAVRPALRLGRAGRTGCLSPRRSPSLVVLYDADCPLCRWVRGWLGGTPLLVPLRWVPCGSEQARRLLPWLDHDRTRGEPDRGRQRRPGVDRGRRLDRLPVGDRRAPRAGPAPGHPGGPADGPGGRARRGRPDAAQPAAGGLRGPGRGGRRGREPPR
ncbi:hypothetical protein GCM10025868_18700 [Angustibacter aerolatus]|uniref:DUF393 domain-containing protein n=1 Tax=Angustibacter aerolatus TaxID=1162965 RepID=A0ABQ6JIG5_9ACTN|nr:hypothetical protein [Angustibacter aerolatus]GMA86620.1 hypothetical protein GCM10025868_18700 [Angustibacter aerolatus]